MPVNVQGCIYPTNAEFRQLNMDLLPRLTQDRLGFSLLPFRTTEMAEVVLNRPDIFRGMQQWRGLNAQDRNVTSKWNPWGERCVIQPGYWGEWKDVDEDFLTRAAQFGTCATPIDLTEHMTKLMTWLTQRELDRQEFLIWQALVFGYYEAHNASGQVVFNGRYNIREVVAGTPWSDIANATPLNDFRAIRLMGRGTSASFGSDVEYIMNQVTANCLFRNQNPHDIGKIGLSACCTFMGPDMVNQQFAAQGLGKIRVYDQGYIDDTNTFVPYLPDGKVLIVGKRPDVSNVGNYTFTRNALGCSISSGSWVKVVDSCENEVPRRIVLHKGHNGVPIIEYPRAVVVLNTGCAL